MARLFCGAKFPASAGSKFLHFFPYLPASIPSLSGIPDRCVGLGPTPITIIQFLEDRNLLQKFEHPIRRLTHRFLSARRLGIIQSEAKALAAASTASWRLNASLARCAIGCCLFDMFVAPS
jgi:hypothetical protein